MTTDVDALASDMLRFASLLRLIRQPQLAQNYEALAVGLQSDPSDGSVEDARAWVRATLRGGAGGLFDRYVQKEDGARDEVQDQEYQHMLQKLADFAHAGEPLSPSQDRRDSLFSHGNTCFRQVQAPVRKGLFMRGRAMFEVMTAPGVTRLVTAGELPEAVGYGPQRSRRDFQECQAAADRLFRERQSEEWVHYSSAQVVPGELLRGLL